MKLNDYKNTTAYLERAFPKNTDDLVKQTIATFLHPTKYHGIIETEDDLGNAVWIAGLSITRFDAEKHLPFDLQYDEEERKNYIEKEGIPHFIARFIIMSSDTAGDYNPTIMGHEVYFRQDFKFDEFSEQWGHYNSIWEDLWTGSQPALTDSEFMEGLSWVNELAPFSYLCIDNPFENENPRVFFSDNEEKLKEYYLEIMVEEGFIKEEQLESFRNNREAYKAEIEGLKKKFSKPKTYATIDELKENK